MGGGWGQECVGVGVEGGNSGRGMATVGGGLWLHVSLPRERCVVIGIGVWIEGVGWCGGGGVMWVGGLLCDGYKNLHARQKY